MLMFFGKKLWLYDVYGIRRAAVSFVKDVGNGYASVKKKGCVSTITVKRSLLRRVPLCERKLWRQW